MPGQPGQGCPARGTRLMWRALRGLRDRALGALIGPLLQVASPPPPAGLGKALQAPGLVLVLDGNSLVDELILRRYCRQSGSGAPALAAPVLRRGRRHWSRRLASLPATGLLLPVAVYIGRTPAKQGSLLKLLFSESWVLSRHLGKLVSLVLNGRDTLVVFGAPEARLSDPGEQARRLGAQLDGMRTAVIGPDFSHRRTLVRGLLDSYAIRRAIVADARARGWRKRRSLRRAEKILDAMVADCTRITLRVLHRLLGWFWNRFYDGMEARNLAELTQLSRRSRIVYVPCHRSHIDYLALSYLLYEHNLAIPYIAAGDNLNLPLVGRILRGGGAFFIRRSFRGDPLYAALVAEYMHRSLARGASLEYFIEGGRSRTGRQLPAKPGMLAMTLHSFLRDHRRPLAFVPVHLSYEKLMEGPTYLNELRGQGKRKESVAGLLRSVFGLRGRFGRVVASFGAPLDLAGFLDQHRPGWRAEPVDAGRRPDWSQALVAELGRSLSAAINARAYLNPVHLAALALLATPRQIADSKAMLRQMEVLAALPSRLPDTAGIGVCPLDAPAMLREVEQLDLVRRRQDSLGELVFADGYRAVLLTYYRNSGLHAYILPALIAAAFQQSRELSIQQLQRLVELVYPLLVDELSIASELTGQGADSYALQTVDALTEVGLLRRDGERVSRPPARDPGAARLNLLAGLVQHSLERYFLVVAVLLHQAGRAIGRDALVRRCSQLAERMSALYGVDAPEFFDPSLFAHFIDQLQRRGLLAGDGDQGVVLNATALDFDGDARLLLSDRIRYGVLALIGGLDG